MRAPAAKIGIVEGKTLTRDTLLLIRVRYAEIINNGTDIPGTVIEHCSPAFQDTFIEADIIIAKGQGNFESLHGCGRRICTIFSCVNAIFS